MATKSTRSSGTQPTQRGVNQGIVVVDPVTGLPVTVVEDITGKKRLAVDAQVTATIGDINVELDFNNDSVAVGDPNTGARLKINPNGSVDANVEVDAADGDSIKVVGTEDGLPNGTQHTAKIGADGNLRVKDEAANTSLASIDSKLPTNGQKTSANSVPVVLASDQSAIPVTTHIDAFAGTPDSAVSVGTEDGTISGTKHPIRVAADGSVMARNFSSLVPEPKTKIQIVNRNLNGDITLARFFNGVSVICDLQLSYDAQGDMLSVERI